MSFARFRVMRRSSRLVLLLAVVASTAVDGAVQEIEPVMLVRYSPGVVFVVKQAHVERDRVRLDLHKEGENDLATTLTVKSPAPLSKDLTESALIESALARFVVPQ